MTMLEKVAAALKECYSMYPDEEDWKRSAHAAISAMREPTSGMYGAYRCDELWRNLDATQVWRLWIDAALSEK